MTRTIVYQIDIIAVKFGDHEVKSRVRGRYSMMIGYEKLRWVLGRSSYGEIR